MPFGAREPWFAIGWPVLSTIATWNDRFCQNSVLTIFGMLASKQRPFNRDASPALLRTPRLLNVGNTSLPTP